MVGEARRTAQALCRSLEFGTVDEGKVGIIVTELGTNLCRHAKEGQILLRALVEDRGLEILAIDRGPGMSDINRCMIDGVSSGSSMGAGLGAVHRQSDHFDIYSEVGKGTVILARVFAGAKPAEREIDFGVVCVPYPGETICGDDWFLGRGPQQTSLLVVDGLGHGISANEASEAAVGVAERNPGRPPDDMLKLIHNRLRSTRGAAGSMAVVNASTKKLDFTGIGNVRGCLVRNGETKGIIVHNGTLGLQIRSLKNFTLDLESDDLVILHSDGLTTRWDIASYPGLRHRSCATIAGVLFRDHRRPNDDATVAVLRITSKDR